MLPRRPSIRRAQVADMDGLEALRKAALRRLAASHYAGSHIEAALSSFGAIDPQLIEDGTYFVAEIDGQAVGCGGWSIRPRVTASDPTIVCGPSKRLEPSRDAAPIRAAFVHPEWTRQGIARGLAVTAEAAARQAGFARFILVSTLNAEPVYRRLGYRSVERVFLDLPNQVRLPIVRMEKNAAA